jgi:hypothetical protein
VVLIKRLQGVGLSLALGEFISASTLTAVKGKIKLAI